MAKTKEAWGTVTGHDFIKVAKGQITWGLPGPDGLSVWFCYNGRVLLWGRGYRRLARSYMSAEKSTLGLCGE